jgi:hypothetical protein
LSTLKKSISIFFTLFSLPKKCAKSLEIAKAISRNAQDQQSKAKKPPRLRLFLTLLIAFAAPISFLIAGKP